MKFCLRAAAVLSAVLLAVDAAASAKRVDFASVPEGATVELDGASRGKTPLALFDVRPGRHRVRFTLDGHAAEDLFFSVEDEGYASCSAELRQVKGLLLVTTEPSGCTILENGISLGETPRLVTSLDTLRRHRLELRKAGCQTKFIEVSFSGRTPVVRHEKLVLDSGTLEVSSTPQGAVVSVNGVERGRTPVEIAGIARGRASVRLSLEGFREAAREVSVAPGERQRLDIPLEELPGVLHVTTDPPGAGIFVDGQAQGLSPATVSGLKPGRHTVSALLYGYNDEVRFVEVPRGSEVREEMALQSCFGSIEVRTEPSGVSVIVDGRRKGVTPEAAAGAQRSGRLVVESVRAGEHRVVLRRHGYADVERSVFVFPNEACALDVRMRRVFTPDIHVETDASSYDGVFVSETDDTLTVEIMPNVQRIFNKMELRRREPITSGGRGR